MIIKKIFLLLILCSFGFIGCKSTGPSETTGTLVFHYSVGGDIRNSFIDNKSCNQATADTNTCKIVDVRHLLYKLEVSTGNVSEGGTDNLQWKTLYESSVELLDSEREFPPVELPVGTYKCFRVTQRNRLYWVCTMQADTFEFPDLNDSNIDPDSLSPINVFGEDGLYTYDQDDKFTLLTSTEKLGGFEITAGGTTDLTFRLNFNTLDWFDNDEDGQWSQGDALDNWTLIPGTTTMTDFIVGY